MFCIRIFISYTYFRLEMFKKRVQNPSYSGFVPAFLLSFQTKISI